MFLSEISEQGATPALVKTLAFQESRMKMIAENIANAQTPGYRAKQLDVAGFQRSLREALANRDHGAGGRFDVRSGDEVATDEQGLLRVQPSEVPAENVLFHDGTNLSIERQMADLAETSLWSDLAGRFLQGRYERLTKAIRGSV